MKQDDPSEAVASTTAAERGDGERAPGASPDAMRGERPDELHAEERQPDVVVDVPTARVRQIDVKLEDLRAHIALNAHVADLIKLDAGIEVTVAKLDSKLDDVEAQVSFQVQLQEVCRIIDRALTSIDRNPGILQWHAALHDGQSPPMPDVPASPGSAPETSVREPEMTPMTRDDSDAAAEEELKRTIERAERADWMAAAAGVAQARSEEQQGQEPAATKPEEAGAAEQPADAGHRQRRERHREPRSFAARAVSRAVARPRAILRTARDVAGTARALADMMRPGRGGR